MATRIALLYPGDNADPASSRFAALFEACAQAGLLAEPALWHDDRVDALRAQLLPLQAVLVWCNPIEDGRRRHRLDALLAELAAGGVLVSAHPEAVQRLGTKDVLLATRGLPFGSDVRRIDCAAQLAAELPARLRQGARVLKQQRGHSGIGVWRVALGDDGLFDVQQAQRGSRPERVDLAGLQQLLAPYFEADAGGHLIDQAWQPGLVDGMTRAYLVGDRVGGFGHQAINALHPGGEPPGPRLYHEADAPRFQTLRARLEGGWIEQLRAAVGLPREQLPLLWDCDFLPGADGEASVLCEINVSSVSPYPPSCNALIVAALRERLG